MHIMVANYLQFIIALLLCMPTAATLTDNANPPYKFCFPTAEGECSLVDVSRYHLYDEVSQTELTYTGLLLFAIKNSIMTQRLIPIIMSRLPPAY